MSRVDEPNCRNCANRYDLVQFDYTKGGCKHTKMDGFICMAFADERKAIWMVGADYGCECFIKYRGIAEHEQID